MIPVKPEPEPADFGKKVREPGMAWIKKKGLKLDASVPPGKKVSALWGKCSDQLWVAYKGICAYSCLYINKTTGSTTVEHYRPKSRKLRLAFEWSNYRLVCGLMNSRKSDYEDVLDPFEIQKDTFALDLMLGTVLPGADVSAALRKKCELTIDRLNLNEQKCRDERLAPFNDFIKKDITPEYLKRVAPFVWYEARRQGYL